VDHGTVEEFCADGCDADPVGSNNLREWLEELETTSGANQVTVIIEACRSGSFIDRYDKNDADSIFHSISKNGRVVIASTGRDKNAFVSADGAYFSDGFFSAVAEGKSVLASFTQAKAAVEMTPYAQFQTPWLDDNGDWVSSPADGTYAASRYVANFLGGSLPEITAATVTVTGSTRQITAWVERGDDEVGMVWAAVYAPSFHPPTTPTLELGVPLIALQPDLDHEGVYTSNYSGFSEPGSYKVVVYARDTAGNYALPKLVLTGLKNVFLPLIKK
jgi:hypothetical protein